MSAAERLVAGMTKWAETLSEEEKTLLTQILARSLLQVGAETSAAAADGQPATGPRLRLTDVDLSKLIGACVESTAKTASKHGIKLINSGDMATPQNSVVWECWKTITP